MARRLQLHEKLCATLGSRNVYFQPPASVKLVYDCIIYKTASRDAIRADDRRYIPYDAYDVTFISRDPDSEIPGLLLESFRYIEHQRTYTADNLHHDLFRIYY